MSTTSRQGILVHGYCRLYLIVESLWRLISLYFVFPDSWSEVYGSHLELLDHDKCCEFKYVESSYLYNQQTVFGNVLLNVNKKRQFVKWQFEFSLRHHSSYPLFVGISNTVYSTYIGYGISFGNRDVENPWCKPIQCEKVICNANDFERDIFIKDNKNMDLVFGEIEFLVLFQNGDIQVDLKIFIHPHGCIDSENYVTKCSQIVSNVKSDTWSISACLPMCSAISISAFEIQGDINLLTRN